MTPTVALARAGEILKGIEGRPGVVLYSGRDTLVPASLYVMGLIPGGKTKRPGAETGTTGQSLRGEPWCWNSFADEVYRESGPSQLQLPVREVFEELGADSSQTFTANSLFLRSRGVQALTSP